MKCKDYRELFSKLHDRLLGETEQRGVETHLERCSACASQWSFFKESLESLTLLSGEKAPPGFTHRVLRNVPDPEGRAASPAWRWVLSPVGAAFCLVLLFGGLALGFLFGRQQAASPLAALNPVEERNGIIFLSAKSDKAPQYALVPIRGLAGQSPPPSRIVEPAAPAAEYYLGGDETTEFFFRPGDRHRVESYSSTGRGDGGEQDRARRAVLQGTY